MESHQVIRRAVAKVGAKTVAAEMKLSAALVYKWCQEPPTQQHAEASGTRNPLDRVRQLYGLTGDDTLVGWLCRQAGGFLVKNPAAHQPIDASILHTTQSMVREFSELLEAVADSVTNGEGINLVEAERIRKEWEELKSLAEGFVVACERGCLAVGPPG